MKKIIYKKYLKGIIFFLLGVIIFYFLRNENTFIPLFIGTLFLLGGINISSIIFYKSLESKEEIYKYLFSFFNLLILLLLTSKLIL